MKIEVSKAELHIVLASLDCYRSQMKKASGINQNSNPDIAECQYEEAKFTLKLFNKFRKAYGKFE